VVSNGTWHQAVVVPGRTLYLDGKQVATGTGQTLTLPAPANTVLGDYAMLGTGLLTSCSGCAAPPNEPWEYLNGSMADAAIWQNQIPGPDAIAAQYAAETTTAQELTTITSPAGRTQLSATYDPVNDRAASLTDANGGTWTYGGPVDTATSAAYHGAVMADSAQDFWPLDDTSETTAENLVGSAATSAVPRPPATYSGVTLGQPGPLPDASAVGFSGSGSQVSVPTSDFNAAAPTSAEAWFNTSTIGQQFLITGANGALSGDPLVLEVNSSGCLEAYLQDNPFTDAIAGCSNGTVPLVDDGYWHQAVATLGPRRGDSDDQLRADHHLPPAGDLPTRIRMA
jgi:hypothetical protein